MSFGLLAHAAYETLKISLPTVLEGAEGDPEAHDVRLASWSAELLGRADVRLTVSGRENIEPQQSYVVMSNHQSHYDIPIVFQALQGLRLRMVAKRELFRIPIWASAMRNAGFIELDRASPEQARQALGTARQRLGEHSSVWIAPEGTRSTTGALGPFKLGGFVLALDAGVPILPLAIDGSRRIQHAQSLNVHPHQAVRVTIERPIHLNHASRERAEELSVLVRAAIEKHLPSPEASSAS